MNKWKLRQAMEARNIAARSLSEAMGWPHATAYRKINGVTELTLSQIKAIREIMRLSDDEMNAIFFAD